MDTTMEKMKYTRVWNTITDIKEANAAIGHSFFSKDTMSFFNSRVESRVLSKRYFITSEQPPYGPRCYTARIVDDEGRVDTIGPHCKLSYDNCKELIRRHAKGEQIPRKWE